MFRHPSRQQRILAILMLLGLLFQVQTVLACQMMDAKMPAEQCCCDDVKMNPSQEQSEPQGPCCKADAELTLKEPDLDKKSLALVQSSPSVELAEIVPLLLLAAIWPEEVSSDAHGKWAGTPQYTPSSTKIYLSTQRLRI